MQGKLIIFSAPSGSGKTTVVRHLLHTRTDLDFSISATTRRNRSNEIHGKDYYFISREEFDQHIRQDDFVEWEEVYSGTCYGTLKSEIDRIWASGKHVIFDVDVIGGLNIKNMFGDRALDIFLRPPSLEELEKRLLGRATETTEKVQERVTKARHEITYENQFGTVIVNENLAETLAIAEQLVETFINGE